MRIHSIIDWILPSLCILCGYLTRNAYTICEACQRELPILPHSCQQCAQFLRFSPSQPLICGYCQKDKPAFDLTHALFPYEPPISQFITRLKFQGKLQYAKTLSELMTLRIQTTWYNNKPLPDLIIPIPLHKERLQQRGFNQTTEIARPIARALKIPIDNQLVKRIKPTLAQSGLTRDARVKNIAHAFAINKDLSGKTIALLDDVITTGNTVRECAKLLKKHGATRIDVWCLARNG